MDTVLDIIASFKGKCTCGFEHYTAVRDVRIGRGLVHKTGEILAENGFCKKLLLVADKNTFKAANGIVESLAGFEIEYKIYDTLRVAEMKHVEEIERLIEGKDISVLSVGTGSVNDPCRLAAARQNKMLCIFATAPSMDGFASYSSPIVKNGFKSSYAAKSPEVIIGDTEILAKAPACLKSAGFGDMIAKYVALVDWKLSNMLIGEKYCEKVAKLTRDSVDGLMKMADKVTLDDPDTAGEIFKSLLMTGIGMSFMQNSRPASGCEHVIAHLIECVELRDGIIPNYHGEDVGVCTLYVLKYLGELAKTDSITAQKETVDFDDVYDFYGEMADDVRKMNTPDTVTDGVDPRLIEEKWGEIVDLIRSVPGYDECRDAMKKAGCKLTVEDIGKSRELFDSCVKYSPFMRRRLTILRLNGMIDCLPAKAMNNR